MFKVLTEGCEPTRGTKYSACVDLYASHDCVVGAGETKLIGLGVCIDMDWNFIKREFNNLTSERQDDYKEWFKNSHYLQLMLRSSLGKKGLILPNGVGAIDMDYDLEIKMIIHNPLRMVDYDVVHNTITQYGSVCDFDKEQLGTKYAEEYTIEKGDKIGQITLLEHKSYLFGIDTEKERDGGFGSSGAR